MATTKRDERLRYLKLKNGVYYVRVKIPRDLQAYFKNTHRLKSLRTRSLEEANDRKWNFIKVFNDEFKQVRRTGSIAVDSNGSLAASFRNMLKDERGKGATVETINTVDTSGRQIEYEVTQGDINAEAIEELAAEEANKILDKTNDLQAAKRFFSLATSRTPTLDELVDEWLEKSNYRIQTQKQHKLAYKEFRTFISSDATPLDITDSTAMDYVEAVEARGQAYNTKRRKINSLMAFWRWMIRQKRILPKTGNVWSDFDIQTDSKTKPEEEIIEKRPYTVSELKLLFKDKPTYKGLADLMVLGLYTGARIEELASIKTDAITKIDEGYLFKIVRSKTKAGKRTFAITNDIPCRVISRRLEKNKKGYLFPELKAGGYDDKKSWHVGKAFGRLKAKLGFNKEVDFHSFRRNLITLLENKEGIGQVKIARYVGHHVNTMAADRYSEGADLETMVKTANAIKYSRELEKIILNFSK